MAESFEQWLARKQAGLPAPAARPTSSQSEKFDFSALGGKKNESGPMSFLNTAIDILSRPLYAVGETGEAIVDLVTPNTEDDKRSPLEKFGALATAIPRGLFSTNEEDKTHGADLLEHATDRFGQYNPAYVDREDNVDPAAKGVLGFVGDVALDPLTYIPAAWGVKAANAVGGAVKGALGAAKTKASMDDITDALVGRQKATDEDFGQGIDEAAPEGPAGPGGRPQGPDGAAPAPGAATPTEKTFMMYFEPQRALEGPPPRALPGAQRAALPTGAATTRVAEDVADEAIPTPAAAPKAEPEAPKVDPIPEPKDAPKTPSPEEQAQSFLDSLRLAVNEAPLASGARTVLQQFGKDAEAGFVLQGGAKGGDVDKAVAQLRSDTLSQLSRLSEDLDDAEIFLPGGLVQQIAQRHRLPAKSLFSFTPGTLIKMIKSDPSSAIYKAAQDIMHLLTTRADVLSNSDMPDAFRAALDSARLTIDTLKAGGRIEVESAFDAFLARERAAQDALGSSLSDWLRKRSATQFESIRERLLGVLDERADVADWLATSGRDDIAALARLGRFLHLPREFNEKSLQNARQTVLDMRAAIDKGGQYEQVGKALAAAYGTSFTRAYETYTVRISTTARRAGERPGIDEARIMKHMNTHVMFNVYKQINHLVHSAKPDKASVDEWLEIANRLRTNEPRTTRSGKRISGAFEETREVFGKLRARTTAEFNLARLQELDDINDVLGIRSMISQWGKFSDQFGLSGKPVPLSLNDVYGTIYRAAEGTPYEDDILRTLFHREAVGQTILLGTVVRALEDDAVDAMTLADLLKINKSTSDNPLPNYTFGDKKLKPLEEFNPRTKEKRPLIDGDQLRRHVAEFLLTPEVRGALRAKLAVNADAYAARVARETHKMTKAELDRINAFVLDGASRAKTLAAAAGIRKRVADEATETGAYTESAHNAIDLIEGSLGKPAIKTAEASQALVRALENGEDGAKQFDDMHESIADNVMADATEDGLVDAADEAMEAAARADEDIVDAEVIDDVDFDLGPHVFDGGNPFGPRGPVGGAPRKPKSAKQRRINVMAVGAGAMLQKHIAKLLNPSGNLQKVFDQNFGMQNVNPIRLAQETVAHKFAAANLHTLNRLSRKYPTSDGTTSSWQKAWQAIRTGDDSTLDDVSRGLYDELLEVTAKVLPADPQDGFLASIFFVNNDIAYVEQLLEKNGLRAALNLDSNAPLLDIERAKDALKAGQYKSLQDALSQQWRDWEVKDIRGLLSRMSWAVAEAAEARSVNEQFKILAKNMGALWDPKTAAKGARPPKDFVKIVPKGESHYGAFVDQTVFYHKDLARELVFADEFMRQPKRMSQKLVTDYYQPLLSTWKFTVTVMRPGHHTRNMIGDWSSTWLAFTNGAGYVKNFVKRGNDALGVILAHMKYEDVDAAAALRGLKTTATGAGPKVRISTRHGDLDGDDIYDAAMKEGLFPSVAMSEDLFFDETGQAVKQNILQRTEEFVRENRVGRFAGGISELRDHYARLHHFMLYIEHNGRKFGTKEELFAAAAANVRKFHPDASLLTRPESKYARMVFPFYSWLRGIIPAVLESAVRNPASLTIIPKLSYNSAVAMGLNPESLYEPYPEDQLFPSFITGQALGPQFQLESGEYININPGLSNIDVFNELGTDPFRNLLGMVSPIVRVPAELAAGGQWATGSRINDTSDYVDSQIPMVNYLANVTGYSPSSILLDQGLERQAGHQPKENGETSKSALDQGTSAFNWLTGLGVSNVSRPSFINYAEIEKRNREGS